MYFSAQSSGCPSAKAGCKGTRLLLPYHSPQNLYTLLHPESTPEPLHPATSRVHPSTSTPCYIQSPPQHLYTLLHPYSHSPPQYPCSHSPPQYPYSHSPFCSLALLPDVLDRHQTSGWPPPGEEAAVPLCSVTPFKGISHYAPC